MIDLLPSRFRDWFCCCCPSTPPARDPNQLLASQSSLYTDGYGTIRRGAPNQEGHSSSSAGHISVGEHSSDSDEPSVS